MLLPNIRQCIEICMYIQSRYYRCIIIPARLLSKPFFHSNSVYNTDICILHVTFALNSQVMQLNILCAHTLDAGFHGADVYHGGGPHSWAKSTFFICRLAPKYDFVWLMEDDVYIPSKASFIAMLRLSTNQDLVVKSLTSHNDSLDWVHWEHAEYHYSFPEPWYKSLVCVMGMSNTMITKVDDYIQEFRNMGFVEYFFLSIAVHNNLTILNPSTLSTIECQTDFSCENVNNSNMNWFHPVKDQVGFQRNCGFEH